jgi:hypothetical protein
VSNVWFFPEGADRRLLAAVRRQEGFRERLRWTPVIGGVYRRFTDKRRRRDVELLNSARAAQTSGANSSNSAHLIKELLDVGREANEAAGRLDLKRTWQVQSYVAGQLWQAVHVLDVRSLPDEELTERVRWARDVQIGLRELTRRMADGQDPAVPEGVATREHRHRGPTPHS